MTVSDRAKSSYEILEIATLVACFSFDNESFLIDTGPNSLQATAQMTSSISSGRFCQAIAFNGSNSSYFQMSGFTALRTSNRPFSVSVWIRPTHLSGIVLYVATAASGEFSWYMPFLGFTINGSFVVQIWNSKYISLVDPAFSVSTSVWSHVVQTWSLTNGLCLYINNILAACLNSAKTYAASSEANYLTLGNRLNYTTTNGLGLITGLPYQGDMDEFRVYSRELSAGDVSTLFMNCN